jgi:outer membrane receptor protein involved in Fe transport
MDYVDLTASYQFGEGTFDGLTLRAGVTNLLDDGPPIFPAWWTANTYGGSYDLLGRSYWFGLNYAVRPRAR